LAKTVFTLIFTMFLSVLSQSVVFAAEVIELKPKSAAETLEIKPKPVAESATPKPKPDTLGGFSVSSTIGSYFFAGSEQRNVTPLYGVKVGYEKIGKSVTDNLGLEATLNYFTARSNVDAHDSTGYLFRLEASYPFPIKKTWIPSIVVGAGGLFSESNGASKKNFLLNYGLGLKYFIENYLAVRVDARQLGVYENSMFRQNFDVGVGVSYYFGKERIKKAVTPPVSQPVPEKKKIEVLEDVPAKPEEAKKTPAVEKPESATDKGAGEVPAEVAPPVKIDVIKKIALEFDSNSAYLKPVYFPRFKEIATALSVSDDLAVQINGHADKAGKTAASLALADQRVQNVQSSLLKLGVHPQQISVTPSGVVQEKTTLDRTAPTVIQNYRNVDILLVKLDAAAKIKAEQELQFTAERRELERLQNETLAKTHIKATLEFQEVSGALPVDSSSALAFEVINKTENTEEYLLTLVTPKDFDGVLTRANRPEDKVALLQLAPGEKFKGSAQFRIPAGMVDGQKAMLTLKAVSTRYNDVIFQKDSLITCSAPLLRVNAKLSSSAVIAGEKVRYRLTVLNAGSLSARNLVIRVQLPPQVDFIEDPDVRFTQEAIGVIVFKVDTVENGKQAEIAIDVNVRKNINAGQELFWNSEVIDGTLQRRAKTTERAIVVP